jgi:hypothetical protein
MRQRPRSAPHRLALAAALLVAAAAARPVAAAPAGPSDRPGEGAGAQPPPAVEVVPCWEEEPACGGAGDAAPDADPEAAPAEGGDRPAPIVISRASGRGRPDAAQMAAWHPRYRKELAPVKAALGRLLAALESTRPADLGPYCRRLAASLAALDRERLLPAPGLAADLYLKAALAHLGGVAAACSEGSFARTDYHLLEAGRAIQQLDLALRHDGLGW